jgi:MoxR-like ATPase
VTSLDQAGSGTASEGADLDTLARVSERIRAGIDAVIEGKPEVSRLALVVLLAEGHLLIEDVPGVGKTMLSKALARSIDCTVRRIQFTPDLLPSDVTGVSVFNQDTRQFEFRPGGVFANIVVGDEINRASPKTQSALLECMEERQVTVDGTTYQLEAPFMVIATQNPIEMEGTYALPEAQRDRFMARVSMGYPVESAEIAMLDSHTRSNPLDDLEPVTDAAEVRKLVNIVSQVYVAESVQRYAVALTTATRNSPELLLGASPRATLHLVRAGKALAAMQGRDYVIPDDIQQLAEQVLAHRLLPTVEASMSGRTPEAALKHLVAAVAMPESRRTSA